VVYDGFVYDVGEGNSGTTPSSTVVSAGLDSVPRLGYYSSLVDLSGLAGDDPAPAEILTNGGDCSSGACTSSLTNPENGSLSGGPGGIYLNYQLASNGCTKFNSLTTMPTLASGQSFVGTKQPLVFTTDGCSNATAVGRYMRLTYLLDDTQTATFPDATGNHTSISDFTVYYHAASTNRLRGGETFSNANLQALDTPP
jgi:hypothetical protein